MNKYKELFEKMKESAEAEEALKKVLADLDFDGPLSKETEHHFRLPYSSEPDDFEQPWK